MSLEQEKLIIDHLSFAKKLAKEAYLKFGKRIPLDEIQSFAFLGLTQASKRYNPSLGRTFAAYSSRRIKGAILDGVRTLTDRRECSNLSTDADIYWSMRSDENEQQFGITIGKHDQNFEMLVAYSEFELIARQALPTERRIIHGLVVEGKSRKVLAKELDITEARICQLLQNFRKRIQAA